MYIRVSTSTKGFNWLLSAARSQGSRCWFKPEALSYNAVTGSCIAPWLYPQLLAFRVLNTKRRSLTS